MAKQASSAGIKETGTTVKGLLKYEEFRDSLLKITPLADKLNARGKRHVATLKSLQRFDPDNPEYSNDTIRKEIMSRLGVASGEFDDYDTIGRDSAGRSKLAIDQKEQNPRGFKHGGKVCHGQTEQGSAEKN